MEIVLAAVTQRSWALRSASEALRNDREIVLAAVLQNGMALQSASAALRNDQKIFFSIVAKRIFKRFRWPRLVKTLLRFERDDAAFKSAFEPSAIEMQVDETFLAGGDEVGPQPTLHARYGHELE